jgi:hypothetical protein
VLTVVSTATTFSPSSTSNQVGDCFTLTLPSSTTATSFAVGGAPLNGWLGVFIVTQPAGGNSYTFALAGGSGVNIVYPTSGGCASLPTMPTGTGHALILEVIYNSAPSTPELDVTSCQTTGS